TLKPDARPPSFGIVPLMWGTFLVATGSSMIALPIGLASAIYLSEYAPRPVRSVLKPTLELLAGIPTIVYGYLALLLVTPALKGWVEPLGLRVETYNALAACIVVGVMIIPLVSSLSEDVLSSVPRGLREAAYGLGATKFEVSTRVVLPAGLSGVLASFILAVSRAGGGLRAAGRRRRARTAAAASCNSPLHSETYAHPHWDSPGGAGFPRAPQTPPPFPPRPPLSPPPPSPKPPRGGGPPPPGGGFT